MKENFQINENILDNKDRFNDAFFKRFDLRHNDTPLQLSDTISKNYLFPTLYGDVSCSIAIFHCDYQAARKIMPAPSIKPVKMTHGRSLVIFSCYEYRNVLNVAPYNEIAMTIPVMTDGGLNIPVLSMLLGDKLKKFGYYVFNMPVTSLENRIRGRKIWGLPKNVERIDITHENKFATTKVSVDDQAPYLELNIPMVGRQQEFDIQSNLYSILDGRRLASTTSFKGNFSLTKNMTSLFKKSTNTNSASIILGRGPQADRLRALKIEGQAFQLRYCSSMNACFDLAHTEV
ncbi:acetoacetate decarboxylase family protein [Microbulbifer sp. OS29]|uniref:Acetoacetate decarboxylase family protein n=1 Tax=Microbulbifer okhotskensis TaxID=2926617 RepID=A0A9X2EP57_9GAMM|nr:acetoacetate decarboxylase family protein [Microbulbifer okhotskensis]MCO1335872.1 acetoacetate decarboxylase family protein [Microbulbifer okhotskensis]